MRSKDGLRLHARDYRGGEARGRLPVIGLPGLTRNASEFHQLAHILLKEGVTDRFVAVDYRGRGLSDHDPDTTHYSLPVESADLLVLLAELGIESALFIGVSRGGLIAMGLAAGRPELVRGIVLNDVGPVLERTGLLRIKGYVGQSDPPADLAGAAAALKSRFEPFFPAIDDRDWHDWASGIWTGEPGALQLSYDPALVRTLDSLNETDPLPDLWALWDLIKSVPILVIRGTTSDLLSAETVGEMARRHPGLVAIDAPGEGHTPFLHRPALAAAIADFLKEVGDRPVPKPTAG